MAICLLFLFIFGVFGLLFQHLERTDLYYALLGYDISSPPEYREFSFTYTPSIDESDITEELLENYEENGHVGSILFNYDFDIQDDYEEQDKDAFYEKQAQEIAIAKELVHEATFAKNLTYFILTFGCTLAFTRAYIFYQRRKLMHLTNDAYTVAYGVCMDKKIEEVYNILHGHHGRRYHNEYYLTVKFDEESHLDIKVTQSVFEASKLGTELMAVRTTDTIEVDTYNAYLK